MSNDINKVKDIISNSGNTFHCKVLKYLQEKGWTVLISPYYNDNVSGKPREIDLIAEKAFNAKNIFGDSIGTINVKLFIECKFISKKTVFWFHEKDKQKAEYLVTQTTQSSKDDIIYMKEHHYLNKDSVAKLFANEEKKSTDNDIFYKALNQSLNAMIYFKNQTSIIKPNDRRYIRKILNYPLIVCNSFENLYRVEIDTDSDPLNISENFQLEVNYAYMTSNGSSKNEYFIIDILNFDSFNNFLEIIEHDTKLVRFSLIKT